MGIGARVLLRWALNEDPALIVVSRWASTFGLIVNTLVNPTLLFGRNRDIR